MKRGKDEDKTMGPMFPRLHVNDTEKGGPRAPPRNKMALYEQLSIPSQRFNGAVASSSTRATVNERGTFPSHQQSSSSNLTKKPDTHQFDNNQRMQQQQQHKRGQEEDDIRVPIFDQQSGTSQNRSSNHQNRENKGITPLGATLSNRSANVHSAKQQHTNNVQKENSQCFDKSAASNQATRQYVKAPLKDTNVSSSFNVSNNENFRSYRVDPQVDNTLWGDSLINGGSKASGYGINSVPLREIQEEAPSDPTNGDAVSENSMVDSICGVDISPDDVVGIIGQKHFWKARRAIVNQQRVFAVQVFELHRLIKVQRSIAGSPHLLAEEQDLTKPPKVFPIKKIPLEYVMKPTLNTPKQKTDTDKPNDDMEFSSENLVGKASLSTVQNGSQTTYCRPFSATQMPPLDQNMGSWNYNAPPGQHQWLIPVMSPSEGLVYKPYPAPGFMSPAYGGCGSSMPVIGQHFASYGVPPPHHYDGFTGVNPFTPPLPSSHGYFPAYGMQMANPSVTSSTRFEPSNTNNQGSTNVPVEKNRPTVPNVVKLNTNNNNNNKNASKINNVSKDSEVQASTASSRSDRTKDRNALPLFPTSPAAPAPAPAAANEPARVETACPTRVIKVVPHNAWSATASVARIFKSIQEERKQYGSG